MNITAYPLTDEVLENNVFLMDGAGKGTKTVNAKKLSDAFRNMTTNDEYFNFLDHIQISPSYRKSIYRGKNLGSSFTEEQKRNIANGYFQGFFIGDYWTDGTVKWVIADINYWLGTGDRAVWANHLVIVPDRCLGENRPMNTANFTTGGYEGSAMRGTGLSEASSIIFDFFGQSSIYKHRELFTNAASNGYPSSGLWADSTIDLMNEPMVYGSYMMTPASNGTVNVYRHTIDKNQLALFRLNTNSIIALNKNGDGQNVYWLRDVVSAAYFAFVSSGGVSYYNSASGELGVRPCFGIVGV